MVTKSMQTGKILKQYKLRVTDTRKQVLQLFLLKQGKAISHQHLESNMGDSDRVTLYRTLKTFQDQGLIHEVHDGSGTLKYALCHEACNHIQHFDNHAHFYCNTCKETICLDEISASLSAPPGYQISETHILMKGICNDCLS